MITVINRKTAGHVSPAVDEIIDIGRPNLLANRFHIGKDGNRAKVLELHRSLLWEQIKANSPAAQELKRITRRHLDGCHIVLSCYCKPKPCHGDTLKAAIMWLSEQKGI